jgi:hypothetical protein
LSPEISSVPEYIYEVAGFDDLDDRGWWDGEEENRGR